MASASTGQMSQNSNTAGNCVRNGKVPPKRPDEGSWDHVQYVPIWTDPNWEDEGPNRQKTDWKFNGSQLDKVRPALLVQDQPQNPTKYAERFGIFPGRSDGRSRTSPTRSKNRILFGGVELGDPPVRSGEDLFARFEELAKTRGLPLDDYMIEERPDLKTVNDVDQAYMQAYEELLIDEYWQSNLFGDMTMDEMHADGVFTMEESKCDLSGPLDPLLQREMWVDTSNHGTDPTDARVVYGFEGERAEYDPRNNDKVWEALQPALQLATRLLQADEPFLDGLQDITNRSEVPSHLDGRADDVKAAFPKLKFKRGPNSFDLTLLKWAQALREFAGFSSKLQTYRVLNNFLSIYVHSGHYAFDGTFEAMPVMGLARPCDNRDPNSPIEISVAAELIWPLLVDRFSTSEKMMASLTIATTIVHELMHAWVFAHHKFLSNLDTFWPTRGDIRRTCELLYEESAPFGHWDSEEYFEDDAFAEVGHAYETHVLGGGTWTLGGKTHPRAAPPLLLFSGIAMCFKYPDGSKDTRETLAYPPIRTNRYYHLRRIADVQPYFLESFWNTAVEKYGMSVMRRPPEKPHKIFYAPDEVALTNGAFLGLTHFGTDDERRWITDYIEELRRSGLLTLHQYVRSITAEMAEFCLMIERFSTDYNTWAHFDKEWFKVVCEATMIMFEFQSSAIEGQLGLQIEEKRDQKRALYGNWKRTLEKNDGLFADEKSFLSHSTNGGFDHWSLMTADGLVTNEQRLVMKLNQLLHVMENEAGMHESKICELYSLPSYFFQFYKANYVFNWEPWVNRASRMAQCLLNLGHVMAGYEGQLPSWRSDFQPRFWKLAQDFENICEMLAPADNSMKNWRDKLQRIPMMRKSKRKPWERWFFLAKKEMLSLRGPQLAKLQAFKTLADKLLSYGHKIVLPDMRVDEQTLVQRWQGLLDDVLEKNVSGAQVSKVFDLAPVHNLRQQFDEDEDERVVKNLHAVKEWLSSKENGKQPPSRPHIALPEVQGHPTSFSSPCLSTPGIPGDSALAQKGPFEPYSNRPSPFPTPAPGTPPVWRTRSQPGSSPQVEPIGTGPRPAAPVVGVPVHPYAVRDTLTRDLQNLQAEVLKTPSIQDLAGQGLRPNGVNRVEQRLGQGHGTLGNLDDLWERQSGDLPASHRAPSSSGDEMDIDNTGAAHAFVWLDGDDTDDEEKLALLLEEQILQEMSEASTAYESTDVSECETVVDSEVDSGVEFDMESTKGKKRKGDWDVDDFKRRKTAV